MSRARRLELRVLTYHRVAEPEDHQDLNPRTISATPDGFERQMRLLRRRYAVVSLAEVLNALGETAALPRRAVHVTFDDAYADLADHALPILEQLGLPATIFVPTAFPDHPERSFWTDRLYSALQRAASGELVTPIGGLSLRTPEERRAGLKRLLEHLKRIPHADAVMLVDRVCENVGAGFIPRKSSLGWDELRSLVKRGIAVAAHSRSHAILTRLPPEEVRKEVAGAREDLERELGQALPVFCYPNGSHDDRVVSILREEGYRLAFTTLDGHNDLSVDDPLRLRRTNITPRTSGPIFRLRLTGWGARLDARRHRRPQ